MSGHSGQARGQRRDNVSTVVIGAGQAGLAVSCCLDQRGIDHVVLERGEIANSWRTERWDSLRLLTPNWQCQLPGFRYAGDQPHGFMPVGELVEFMDAYARHNSTPVFTDTQVCEVTEAEGGYCVATNRGDWYCQALVIATGPCNKPVIPRCAADLPEQICSLDAHQYRNPEQLEPGGVLVVGASATGLQFAEEIQRSGRPVTLSVGEHVRMPRRYRGGDILDWMDLVGLLDESYQEVDDIQRARGVPSPQLIGSENGRSLDLNGLMDQGVNLVGRLAGVQGQTLQFSGALNNVCQLADLKMNRLLRSIDEWIAESGLESEVPRPDCFEETAVPEDTLLQLDVGAGQIRTVIWACGFRPDYRWLNVPVLDRKGRIRHAGGVADVPGVYAMGLPFMRRRKSSFIYGVSDDAQDITAHLAGFLAEGSVGKPRAVA